MLFGAAGMAAAATYELLAWLNGLQWRGVYSAVPCSDCPCGLLFKLVDCPITAFMLLM
jgi:hypothetical protein